MLKIVERLKAQKKDHINSFSECFRSEQKFYITYADPPESLENFNEFVFNFGITNNIERRINEHMLKWGARKEYTMFLDCNDDSFIRPLETFIKRLPLRNMLGAEKSEFRMGKSDYHVMGNELVRIANNFPEKKIIFHFMERPCEFESVVAGHFKSILYRKKMLFSDFGYYKGFIVKGFE